MVSLFIQSWARSTRLVVLVTLTCLGVAFCAFRIRHGHPAHYFSPPNRKTRSNINAAPRALRPTLDQLSLVQHGHIVEVSGVTDAGAVVMINGERAAVVFDNHTFHHFVGPLPSGTTILTVTSQTEQGGVNTRQLAVTLH